MPTESTCTCNENIFEIKIDGVPEADEVVALVNECYAKYAFKHALWDFRGSSLSGFGAAAFKEIAAAGAMFAEKRGAGWERVSLGGVRDSDASDVSPGDAGLVDLELALEKLEAQSERQARVVELRYFGGLSVPDAARGGAHSRPRGTRRITRRACARARSDPT